VELAIQRMRCRPAIGRLPGEFGGGQIDAVHLRGGCKICVYARQRVQLVGVRVVRDHGDEVHVADALVVVAECDGSGQVEPGDQARDHTIDGDEVVLDRSQHGSS